MTEPDFLLAGISHYFSMPFGSAEGHTCSLHYTGCIFLFLPETNLKAHLSTLHIGIRLVSKKAKSSFVIQNPTCNLHSPESATGSHRCHCRSSYAEVCTEVQELRGQGCPAATRQSTQMPVPSQLRALVQVTHLRFQVTVPT